MTANKQALPVGAPSKPPSIKTSILWSLSRSISHRRKRFAFAVFCFFVISAIFVSREDLRLHYWWRLLDDRHLRRVYRRAPDVEAAPIGVLVNVSGCVIPEFDSFDESVAALLDFEAEARLCRGEATRVVVEGNVISINSSAINSDIKLTRCVITPLRFNGATLKPSIILKDIEFSPNERRDIDAEFARVVCWRQNFLGVEARDFVNFVPLRFRDPEKSKKKAEIEKASGEKKDDQNSHPRFSVHLIGIDSTSRHNSVRYLPKTRRFLEDLGAIEFFGYNKVGDNTLANVIPALTGLSSSKAFELPMTNWQIIWQEFANSGFWTIYGEDWDGKTRTFNKIPQELIPDHFFTPFALEMDKNGFCTYLRDCYGDKLAGEKLYEWYLQALRTHSKYQAMNNSVTPPNSSLSSPLSRDRMFSLIWTNNWSHEELNLVKRADEPTLAFLKEMKRMRIFEDDVLLFFSDHGLRFGRILETRIGRQELSMPVLMISLPPWFHQQFQPLVKNLKTNGRRLTTPFDLHETLRHLLRLQGEDAKEVAARRRKFRLRNETLTENHTVAPHHVFSLFDEVPENRTCAQAGIPQQYCSCGETLNLSIDDPDVLASAEAIVKSLNAATRKFEDLCVRLKLNEIRRSYRKLTADGVTMLTTIATFPGEGVFEMTVSKSTDGWRVDAKEFNRLDSYGDESDCLPWYERFLRKICYCYEQRVNKGTTLLTSQRSAPLQSSSISTSGR